MTAANLESAEVVEHTTVTGLGLALGGWVVAFLLAAVTGSIALAVGAPERSIGVATAGQLGLWVGFAGAPVLARHRRVGPLAEGLGLRLRLIDLPIGIAAGAGTQLVAIPVLYRLLGPIVDLGDASAAARDTVDRAPGALVVLLVLTTVVGAPVVEELFWRGLLLRGLRVGLRAATAVPVAGLLFGATHFQLAALPGLSLAGVVFALLADRSRRLGPAIIAHATFNAITVATLVAPRL